MSAAALYDIPTVRIDGSEGSLGDYAGKVMLIVNVASKCGLTPQYEGLERLYAAYRDRGLVVLGFPANDFAGQEPGTEEDIASFCRSVYGVDFPMFAKTMVVGPDKTPLYALLTEAAPQRTLADNPRKGATDRKNDPEVRWNFEKFLVDRRGTVVGRFDPDVIPLDPKIVTAIEAALD